MAQTCSILEFWSAIYPGMMCLTLYKMEKLSQKTGIPQHQISEMENCKRGIGKERARKLAQALNVSDYRLFL